MTSFTLCKHINATPKEVFSVASDFKNAATNFSGIERLEVLTNGPIGCGTRFRETRVMFGRESTEELEITAFDIPHNYAIECDSCGCHLLAKYQFIPDIAGTHVRVTFDSSPVTIFAKLMSPLAILMSGPMKKMIDKDLDDLKTTAEQIAEHVS